MKNISHRNTLKMIYDSKIFLSTSINEGFPTVIIESMILETPIVTTNVGGISEIIKSNENGVFIPIISPKIIAKKINLLLEDKEFTKKITKNAFKNIQGNSWEEITKIYKNTYKKYI